MRKMVLSFVLCALFGSLAAAQEEESGFKPIFDGKSLDGWRGDEGFWRVENGSIVGESTESHPLEHNTFLVWDQGEVDDFELRLQFKISGTNAANSGIQFRGTQQDDGHVIGYQADIDRQGQWLGSVYDEAQRGVLATRGQKAVIDENGERKVEQVADADALWKNVNIDDWNEYSITARDNHITLKVNGDVTAEVLDQDPSGLDRIGLLALQLHAGPPMKVEFKNIRLKRFPLKDGMKKVVFVAGTQSHGYFAHEHNAGCMLLASKLNEAQKESGVPVLATVYTNGWPKDPTAFDNADTVVSYCDGGGGHYLNDRLQDFDHLVQERGVGLVCIHYAVETTAGECGDHFLKWIGGFFEPHWSVNPHWTASFDLPKHPITQGVKPFTINDEWYYHMRFVPDMEGVTPILVDLPPRETLNRPDGPHEGNPYVREAVLEKKEPQIMAWAYERPDNRGRGFGFTGGHFHRNWQHDDFRKLVLNAIVWSANGEVPEQGVPSSTPTEEELEANQDEQQPQDFRFDPIDQNAKRPQREEEENASTGGRSRPVASSPIITSRTPGHAAEISADISGADKLYLVVTDAGDGFSCDWADWIRPRLNDGEKELPLTELKWKSAVSDWGNVAENRNAGGGPLRVNGKAVKSGIGVHAVSIVEYELPKDHKFKEFKSGVGLDNGGTDQAGGGSTSVQFHVFVKAPSRKWLARNTGGMSAAASLSHEAENAIEQLVINPDLEATLFASEPMMTNPSSIDIDHLGRVWVCEAINYRAFANQDVIGENHAPDRILVLEDTNADGHADDAKVFYQGEDVNSAHGILILPDLNGPGLRALVSANDSVFYLIDEDGDLKSDRKELLFTGIAGVQHDHGIHAFHFGPDGKFYFNFGNAGQHIRDKNGNPIIDKAGNVVDNSRNPYQEGMVFRCNPDGSEFETLAWNFRNNWELCVDSYGTIWQSDNDDDGNLGVRINYIMEYGNYGFRDEFTGASWQTPRTNLEEEIPRRHWHQNDPGVIPNLLLTGAGAPTGICVYEGDLLPESLRGAILHCDAGPNICRAYPTNVDGAGYTAEVINLIDGAANRWFRPSDVCVAPDGSVYVADWYDPGVGGHRMQDIGHGRVFRLAPPESAVHQPVVDVSTVDGAVAALRSPNMATRYLAWNALQKAGKQSLPALEGLWNSPDSRMRARALWAIGKLDVSEPTLAKYVRAGLSDADPNIRITAIRLLRQITDRVDFESLHNAANPQDSSAAVRREMAIAIRDLDPKWFPEEMRIDFLPNGWTTLALQYDGQDRWYLEALGIAAEGHWDDCLAVWLDEVGSDWVSSKAARDIVWRSRAKQTPQLIEKILASQSAPDDEVPRYLRALDFLKGKNRDQAVLDLAFEYASPNADLVDFVHTEAIDRLQGFDISDRPDLQKKVSQAIESHQGTLQAVRLISKFNLTDRFPDLLAMAEQQPQSQLAVEAISTLYNADQAERIQKAVTDSDQEQSEALLTALETTGDGRSIDFAMQLIHDAERPVWMRRGAVKVAASHPRGARQLLELAARLEPANVLAPALAAALSSSRFPPIREEALKLYPPPPGRDAQPLPPLSELARRSGDAAAGRVIFHSTGTCAKCHQINGIGQDVGPNLSEIGNKLTKTAFLESILYPSAGISHGFENWLVITLEGQIYTGLLVNETGTEIQLKDDKGVVRTISKVRIEELKKQDVSMMPGDLQKLMSADELVDVVEYLTTLKERTR